MYINGEEEKPKIFRTVAKRPNLYGSGWSRYLLIYPDEEDNHRHNRNKDAVAKPRLTVLDYFDRFTDLFDVLLLHLMRADGMAFHVPDHRHE